MSNNVLFAKPVTVAFDPAQVASIMATEAGKTEIVLRNGAVIYVEETMTQVFDLLAERKK